MALGAGKLAARPGTRQLDEFLHEIKSKHDSLPSSESVKQIHVKRPSSPLLRRVIDTIAMNVAKYGEHFEQAVRFKRGQLRPS